VQQAKVRARLFDNGEEGTNNFDGVDVADLTPLARQAVLDEARRNASGEIGRPEKMEFKKTPFSETRVIHKTFASNREMTNDPQPADEDFGAAEAPAAADVWADWNRWCDSRIAAALATRHEDVVELARATREFADAVDRRLVEMETLCNQLSTAFPLLRAHHPLDLPNPLQPRRVN